MTLTEEMGQYAGEFRPKVEAMPREELVKLVVRVETQTRFKGRVAEWRTRLLEIGDERARLNAEELELEKLLNEYHEALRNV